MQAIENKLIVLLTIFFLMTQCARINKTPYSKTINITDQYFVGTVTVDKVEKLNKYRISILNSKTGASDRIYTPYEIFDMQTGDVNRDGKADICIGIIKPTPFDSVLKKRLFIFQIDRDYIRPLWLSSRLVHPLEAFWVGKGSDDECVIRAIERQSSELYCINTYRWESFGMSFVEEKYKSLSLAQAQKLLNTIH